MGRAVIPAWSAQSMTLSQCMTDCLVYLGSVRHYAAGTVGQYDRTFKQYLHSLSTQGRRDEVRSFTQETVLAFITDLGRRQVSPNTIISKLGALSTLAQFAMHLRDERGKVRLAENPTKGFPWPEPVKTETKFLHQDELRRFLEAPVAAHVRLAIDTLLGTGVRVSEACEANVEDLVDMGGEHYLMIHVKGRKRQGEERQSVPVSPALAQALTDALLARGIPDAGEPLLVNGSGRRWTRTHLTETMARVGKVAGIKRLNVSAHKLRHTANVLARVAGIDPLTRSRMLTHSDPRAQARYDHLLPRETYQARLRQQEALQRYIAQAPAAQPAPAPPGAPEPS